MLSCSAQLNAFGDLIWLKTLRSLLTLKLSCNLEMAESLRKRYILFTEI